MVDRLGVTVNLPQRKDRIASEVVHRAISLRDEDAKPLEKVIDRFGDSGRAVRLGQAGVTDDVTDQDRTTVDGVGTHRRVRLVAWTGGVVGRDPNVDRPDTHDVPVGDCDPLTPLDESTVEPGAVRAAIDQKCRAVLDEDFSVIARD